MDVNDFTAKLISLTGQVTRTLKSLESGASGTLDAEVRYLMTVHPHLREDFRGLGKSLLETSRKISLWAAPQVPAPSQALSRDTYSPTMTDILDNIFEMIDTCLDAAAGRNRAQPAAIATNLPLAASKAKKRLILENDPTKVQTPTTNGIYIPDVHPYESLIKNLSYDDKWMSSLKNSTLQDRLAPIRPLKPAHWIDTQEALAQASIEIGQTDILAVDLENHSFHSYYGFTCLLQLSTRTEDYLVDVIRLRPWIGAHLGPIFASPDILKVLHGAQSDIAWLQRDFNIFIVNLFDTYFAAKALKLPGLSLAYLLATFCQVTVDKQYQLADWRTRPLPEAMATYAQMDTHYLIALFAALVTKIPDADLKGVFVQSSLSALALYRPEVFNVNGWTSLVDRNASLGNLEKKRLQVLYCWREDVARMEDESPPAVLSAAMMKRLASMNPDLVVGHLKGGKIPLPAAVKHAESLVAALKEGSYTFQNTKLETPVKPAEEAPMVVNLQPVKTPVNPVVVNKVATTTTTPPSSRGRISFVKATPTTAVTLPQKQADSVSTEDAKAVAQSMTIVQVTKMAQAAMEQTPEPTFQTVTKEEDSSPAVTPTPLPDQLISLSRKKPLEIDEKELLASSNSNKITMHDPKRRKQKSTSDDIFINFEAAADRYAHPASKESSAQPAHKKDKPAKTKKPQSEKDSGSFKLGSAPKQGNRSMTFSQK